MSGHSGFTSFSVPTSSLSTSSSISTIPPKAPDDPKVDGKTQVGGTGTVPGAGSPGGPASSEPSVSSHPAESRQETAQALVKQLDVLLTRAAEGATQAVDAEKITAVFKGVKIAPHTLNDLQLTAEKASLSFQAINSFSGRELAATVKAENGKFDWDPKSPAGGAIRDTLDALSELSDKLRQLANTVPRNAAEDLEEAIFQCDRRMCEIQTLICQFADILEKGDPLDEETKSRLDSKLSTLLPRQALQMHGNDAAIAAMRESVAPLATRLDTFSKSPNLSMSASDLAALGREISQMANAIDSAVRTGEVNGISVDRSLLVSAKGVLTEVSFKLATVREETSEQSMRMFADKTFGPAPFGAADPKFVPILKHLAPTFATLIERRDALHKAAVKYASDPSEANWREVQLAERNYTGIDARKLVRELGKLADFGTYGSTRTANGIAVSIKGMLGALDESKRVGCTDTLISDLAGELKPLCDDLIACLATRKTNTATKMCEFFLMKESISSQTTHLKMMHDTIERMGDEDFVTSTTVRAAFQGELRFSTLVEARIHGLKDGDVNPYLDDSNAVTSHTLGSGAVNTVFEVQYADGSKHVFKPEAPGRQSFSYLNVAYGTKNFQMVAQLNIASQKTADAFGLGDVMARTSVGSHKGQFGIFMEKAPGKEAIDFVSTEKPEDVDEGELTVADIKGLPDDKYQVVVGRMMRAANRLDWLDMITGQGDRHIHNYMISVKGDYSVSMKGIDNDASFPAYRTGARTFLLDRAKAEDFLYEMSVLPSELFPRNPSAAKALRVALSKDPGVKQNPDGTITLDTARFANPELYYCLFRGFAIHTLSVPAYIDSDLCDKLLELASDDKKRQAFFNELTSHLPPDAVKAAWNRLSEAIGHARYLKSIGHVIPTEDWEKHDVQRTVAGKMPPDSDLNQYTPLPKRKGVAPSGMTAMTAGLVADHERNGYFRRDLMRKIAKKDWFDE